MAKRNLELKHNLHQLFIAINQLFNVVLGTILQPFTKHYGDETMSSRAYRLRHYKNIRWPEKLINLLFFFEKNHCYNSFISEREGRQLPPEARG